MPDSYKKIIALMSIFAISFLLFCSFSVRLGLIHTDPTAQAQGADYVYPIIFLFLQITCIVLAALIRGSRLLIGIPIVLSLFGGMVLLNSPLAALLVLGLPLAILFWSVRENISTRIRMRFSVDVRRPLTTFFLFFIFFGSFVVVPHYENQIQNTLNTYLQDFLPQQATSSNAPTIDLQRSFKDLIDEQVQAATQVCQGDAGCEKMVEERIREESKNFLEQIPMASELDLESDKPIMSEVMDKSIQKMIPGDFFKEYGGNTGSGFFWALIAFLIISPFSIVFSFFTLLGIRIIYSLLHLTGILHITVKNVQQQVIV